MMVSGREFIQFFLYQSSGSLIFKPFFFFFCLIYLTLQSACRYVLNLSGILVNVVWKLLTLFDIFISAGTVFLSVMLRILKCTAHKNY